MGEKSWVEHGRPHCYSLGFGLSPGGQGSQGKAHLGARWYNLHLRQLALASMWDATGARVEAGSLGKKG